jgi:IS30 family transposase
MTILTRNYERFGKYLEQNPDTDVVEMDTVIGLQQSRKVLLTLLFRSCNLMLMFLLEDKTQKSVIEALNWLSDELGIILFQRLFPVILTDRGTEFLNAEAIECDRNGEIKTRLFYCDPQCSWQKGALERNHEFIRYVLPKGTSFDRLKQEDITLLSNHINSLARDKFHGKTPYMLSKVLLDDKLHEVMKLVEIKPDDVCLKPSLLIKRK